MSQKSRDRDNSRRVRTHEKNSGETVRLLGTIIQSIFCAQSGASIRLTVWKWSGESRYPGAFPPVLENFRRASSHSPTDRPWVSEDGIRYGSRGNRLGACMNVFIVSIPNEYKKKERNMRNRDGFKEFSLLLF